MKFDKDKVIYAVEINLLILAFNLIVLFLSRYAWFNGSLLFITVAIIPFIIFLALKKSSASLLTAYKGINDILFIILGCFAGIWSVIALIEYILYGSASLQDMTLGIFYIINAFSLIVIMMLFDLMFKKRLRMLRK